MKSQPADQLIFWRKKYLENSSTNDKLKDGHDLPNKSGALLTKNLEKSGNLNGKIGPKMTSKKGDWTEHEELLLFWYAKIFRCSWIRISKEIRYRSRVAIRNKFVNLFKNNKFSNDDSIFQSLILRRSIGDLGKFSIASNDSEFLKEQFIKKRLLFQLIIYYLLNSDVIRDKFARKMFILIFDKSKYKDFVSSKLYWDPKLVDLSHFIKSHLTKALNLMKPSEFKPKGILQIKYPIPNKNNILTMSTIKKGDFEDSEQPKKNYLNNKSNTNCILNSNFEKRVFKSQRRDQIPENNFTRILEFYDLGLISQEHLFHFQFLQKKVQLSKQELNLFEKKIDRNLSNSNVSFKMVDLSNCISNRERFFINNSSKTQRLKKVKTTRFEF